MSCRSQQENFNVLNFDEYYELDNFINGMKVDCHSLTMRNVYIKLILYLAIENRGIYS